MTGVQTCALPIFRCFPVTIKETAKFIKTQLGQYDLKVLDQIRDVILHKKGNETLIMYGSNLNDANNGSTELANMFEDLITAQANKLGGMLLKTYDSDIFNNWVQTDWIDGTGGIAEITSIDITANDGKLTMDALNLQQKVYNMLNRIAVSGGTYRDWLETVYTAGKYLDRPETPVFIGGMTQYIEFDEVISKSATETTYGSQPLGDITSSNSIYCVMPPINTGVSGLSRYFPAVYTVSNQSRYVPPRIVTGKQIGRAHV